jgi:hypothetical protein
VNRGRLYVVIVMAFLFGHLDGKEQEAGDPSVDGASAMAAPGSRSGGLALGSGRDKISSVCECFCRQKVMTPTAVMSVGDVTLLWTLLWVPSLQ